MDKKQKAKDLLEWYFVLAAREGGCDFSGDSIGEIHGIVDLIVEAAIDEIQSRLTPLALDAASAPANETPGAKPAAQVKQDG